MKKFLYLLIWALPVISNYACSDDTLEEIPSKESGSGIVTDSLYESYLGPWILSGRSIEDSTVRLKYNVTISEKVKGLTYNIYGWGSTKFGLSHPLEAQVQNDGSFTIKMGKVIGKYQDEKTRKEFSISPVWCSHKGSILFFENGITIQGQLRGNRILFKGTPPTGGLTYTVEAHGMMNMSEKSEMIIQHPTLQKIPKSAPYYSHNELISLQKSTREKSINITIFGDGYTEDYDFGENGRFITDAREAMESFFSIEPYTTFRDYFNVMAVATYSPERGCSNTGSGLKVNNTFCTAFEDILNGSMINCNHNQLLKKYKRYDFKKNNRYDIIILLANSDFYGGTAYMFFTNTMPNIAIVPVCRRNNAFGDILKHEAGGHAFGLLADEYVYENYRYIPDNEKKVKQRSMVEYDYGKNITFDYRTNELWNMFQAMASYPFVNYYEGALTYGRGVWRSERNSCMRNMYGRFSTVSREYIYRKIHEATGREYRLEDFIEYDKKNLDDYAVESRTAPNEDLPEPLKDCVFFMK